MIVSLIILKNRLLQYQGRINILRNTGADKDVIFMYIHEAEHTGNAVVYHAHAVDDYIGYNMHKKVYT